MLSDLKYVKANLCELDNIPKKYWPLAFSGLSTKTRRCIIITFVYFYLQIKLSL
jgi:hypothetical protein